MKKLECEVCGGTDLIKQGGFIVCQSCGCKYTLEEAKSMMIQGTVKIDESDKALKWLELADRAYKNSSYEEANKYYSMLLELNPNNYSAIYKKGFCIGWQSSLAHIYMNEVTGGIRDCYRILLSDDSISNADRALCCANMILTFDQWEMAIYSSAIDHVNEFGRTSVSTVKDFQNNACLLAAGIEFILDLYCEPFVRWTIDEKGDNWEILINKTFDSLHFLSKKIIESLNVTFKVKTGYHWSEFLKKYVDDYELVYPSKECVEFVNSLNKAFEKKEKDLKVWKEKVTKEVEIQNLENQLANTPFYDAYQEKKQSLDETNTYLELGNINFTKIKEQFDLIQKKYNTLSGNIEINYKQIEKLKNRKLNRHKALIKAQELEIENNKLCEEIVALETKKENMERKVHEAKQYLISCQSKVKSITSEIENILKEAGLSDYKNLYNN